MIEWEKVEDWLANTGAAAFVFLEKVILAIIAYLIVSFLVKRLSLWLESRMKKLNTDPSARSFVVSLVRYGILLFAIVTIIVQLDIVTASSVAAVIASAGVAISLALQGGLSNFAGGVMILLLKPFRAGDYIKVTSTGIEGTVVKIEMYYTTIHTLENQAVLIPNSNLTGNTITNVTAQEKQRIVTKIGISYQSDLKRAKEILSEILRTEEKVLPEEQMIYVDELADSAVMIGFRAWTRTVDYWEVKWRLNEKIKLRFDQEGIEIPYQQLDVHIREAENAAEAE